MHSTGSLEKPAAGHESGESDPAMVAARSDPLSEVFPDRNGPGGASL
jgi:hypothetical protein